MDKYFVIPVASNTGYEDKSIYKPEHPGVLIRGTGVLRYRTDDTESIDCVEYSKVVYLNNRHSSSTKTVDEFLRLNPDGTVDAIKIYASALAHFHKPFYGFRYAHDIYHRSMRGEAYYSFDDNRKDRGVVSHLGALLISNGALDIRQMFQDFVDDNYPELSKYVQYTGDTYINLYMYYKRHGGQSKTFLHDFMDGFVRNVMIKRIDKYDLMRYIPGIKRNHFTFDGDVSNFDIARVMIPMINPDRGTVSLVDVVKKFKNVIFTEVYNRLEKYTGIPKAYFKMDNCTLTHDECLSFIFSIKEHHTEKSD